MRNLLRFLLRYNFIIIFLLLELIALVLVFSNDPINRGKAYTGWNSASTFVYQQNYELAQYLGLRKSNQTLARENAELRNRVFQLDQDSSFILGSFEHYPAQVINNSIHKEFNYPTLNIGSKDGVEVDMGVVSPFGVVGVVKSVSPNFCRVLSVLNRQLRISIKLGKTNHFGSLFWEGRDYRKVKVSDIPSHVTIAPGDSILTSGFSSIFPPDLLVGFARSSESAGGGNFQVITTELSNDFKRLSTVYVLRNLNKGEIQGLEEEE